LRRTVKPTLETSPPGVIIRVLNDENEILKKNNHRLRNKIHPAYGHRGPIVLDCGRVVRENPVSVQLDVSNNDVIIDRPVSRGSAAIDGKLDSIINIKYYYSEM
jgi:hypothetical protein